MRVELRADPFDPYAELARFEAEQPGQAGKHGATSIFVGTMRDVNEGETVRTLWLEHYPGMTERELSRIADEASRQWPITQALVLHRIGAIQPVETIVLVATWAVHRAAALEATRYLIEELKQRAPFWKKETLDQRARWVEHNTPG
ncbi:MAG: molybdenum cofactor biosynthesis protein MoaE [Methylococcaceae bacterium]|nr:molybdenum cofactor biosynthesis protein MoaE [Methylococcaceae bacterium]